MLHSRNLFGVVDLDFYGRGCRISNDMLLSISETRKVLPDLFISLRPQRIIESGIVCHEQVIDWKFLSEGMISVDLSSLSHCLQAQISQSEALAALKHNIFLYRGCAQQPFPSRDITLTSTPLMDSRIQSSRIYELATNLGGIKALEAKDLSYYWFHSAVRLGPNQPLANDSGHLLSSYEPFLQAPKFDANACRSLSLPSHEKAIYLAHPWSWNYQVYLFETLFAAWAFRHFLFEGYKFAILPDDFRIEAFQALGITRDNLILLQNTPCTFSDVIVPTRKFNLEYIGPDFLEYLHSLQHGFCQRSRERSYADSTDSLHLPPSDCDSFYISRRGTGSGWNRFLLNEGDLLAAISDMGFRALYFEDFPTIRQKIAICQDARIVITTLGANMVNLLLTPGLKCLFVIVTPSFGHARFYWKNLFSAFRPEVKYIEYSDCRVVDNNESRDMSNKPFAIDVTSFCKKLQSIH